MEGRGERSRQGYDDQLLPKVPATMFMPAAWTLGPAAAAAARLAFTHSPGPAPLGDRCRASWRMRSSFSEGNARAGALYHDFNCLESLVSDKQHSKHFLLASCR
jgi:hypothetical protein